MVNRAGQISVLPAESELELNATSDPLFLQSFVNISTDSILDIETSWFIEDSQQGTRWVITNESWMSLGPFNCKGAVSDFVAEICVQNGTTETYSVTVSISDGYEIITNTWSVTYTVWHEPELEPEPEPEPEVIPDTPSESTDNGNTTTSGGFAIDVNTRVILGLIAIVVLLGIIVLFTGRRKIPPPPVRTPPSNLPQMVGQRFR
jgi:hypothetical protein